MMDTGHLYTRESIFTLPFIIFYHKWIKGRKLLIDIIGKPKELPGRPLYYRKEKWTDELPEEIHSQGYRTVHGLHDSILWWFVPMYIRFHNFEEFDIKTAYPDKKDTAITLNDAMLSDADERFKKGLLKTAVGSVADWQKIILMGALAVGVVVISKFLGFW